MVASVAVVVQLDSQGIAAKTETLKLEVSYVRKISEQTPSFVLKISQFRLN